MEKLRAQAKKKRVLTKQNSAKYSFSKQLKK